MAANGARRPVLILGLGNPMWGDDGIGPAVIRALQDEDLSPEVEIWDGGTAGLGLLEAIAERERVLVVDAAEMDQPAGTVVCLGPQDLTRGSGPQPLSPHQLGLAQVLALAGRLNVAPKQVKIWAVQPGYLGWSQNLSPAVQERLPAIIAAIQAEITVPPS